tara:strand:+ start:473 stop:1411 length:939 start_codon:yes stop_codon:yes gene_type:complete
MFKEFYIPQGASLNFIGSKCLFPQRIFSPNKLNEVHCPRLRITRPVNEDDQSLNHGTKSYIYESKYKFDDADLISESKEMTPILIELDKRLNEGCISRSFVINNIERLWRGNISDYSSSFFTIDGYTMINIVSDLSSELETLVIRVQDYFARCREYYYNECERNEYTSHFLLTHQNPFDSYSPRLKLPKNFKSLAVEFDSLTDMMTRALNDTKHTTPLWKTIPNQTDYEPIFQSNNELSINRSVEFADDKVSYRKIFFENDRHEIMKMYEFFDNKAYFHKNRVQIMKEFKEYHDTNMTLIKNHLPDLYERIK